MLPQLLGPVLSVPATPACDGAFRRPCPAAGHLSGGPIRHRGSQGVVRRLRGSRNPAADTPTHLSFRFDAGGVGSRRWLACRRRRFASCRRCPVCAAASSSAARCRQDTMVHALGDLPPHRVVLFDTNPGQLASIAGDALPARYRQRLRRFRHGAAAFKIDYALDSPVPWTNASLPARRHGARDRNVRRDRQRRGRSRRRTNAGAAVRPGCSTIDLRSVAGAGRQAHSVGLRPRATRLHRRRNGRDRTTARTVRAGVCLNGTCSPRHLAERPSAVQRQLRRRRHRRRRAQRPAVDLPPDGRGPTVRDAESDAVLVLGVDTAGRWGPRHVRVARGRPGATRL